MQKKIIILFLILFYERVHAQVKTDSAVVLSNSISFPDSVAIPMPHFYFYSTWIGGEYFFDDTPLTNFLSSLNAGMERPSGYYKFTLISFDYLPRNRMIIGTSFLNQSCAIQFQGGPRLGGFNIDVRSGVRILRRKNLLDFLIAFRYSSMRVRFDSPPQYYSAETNQYLHSHNRHFDYYSL